MTILPHFASFHAVQEEVGDEYGCTQNILLLLVPNEVVILEIVLMEGR